MKSAGHPGWKKTSTSFVILLLLAITFSSCSASQPEKPRDQVSVRLKWSHGAQFAGLYAADQMGFYAQENISVTLDPGNFSDDRAELLTSGEYEFIIMGAMQSLMMAADEVPFVTIAVIYRINPNAHFALKDSGITRQQDFVGKRIMYYPADAVFPALMSKFDIGMHQFETISPQTDVDAFYSGDVDVWTGYLTSLVIEARAKGYELNIIYPDDYGIHIYRDSIITSQGLIDENPELVERFLRATLHGWKYAIENPGETVDMILEYNPQADLDLENMAMAAQIPLVHTGEAEIGRMKEGVWHDMYAILLEQGTLDETFDVGQMYTLEFLERVYSGE